MPLASGARLGPYEVVALLGAGGMGEVYRARDTKLNRDVALKVLPDAFAADPDRLARFRREAQVVASLNHPNIGHVYGLEDRPAGESTRDQPPLALVIELVEGPTLADRISGATGPLDDALGIALQICSGLEAAHEQGIVHRDLKPANIKVRPDGIVKVLDFGLARAFEPESVSSGGAVNTPTATSPFAITGSGVILGTAPYMSPEQARGRIVDKRTDIWAFGCVLFEMLAHRRPFDGETSSDVIASILAREPAWKALPAATPARVRGLLQRCLEKDVTRRLRDIGEARIELERIIDSRKDGAAARRRLARWAVAAAALVLLLGGGFVLSSLWRRPVGPPQYTQITDFADSATAPSLSPDGGMVTFIRGGRYFQSSGQIYVKQLPNGDAVRLTNDARPKFAPVFTPDGSRIAFSMIDSGSWDTWTVPVLGGQPTRFLPNASGLTWLPDGRVLFSEIKPNSPLHMGIVTATEVRAESREVYFPEHERAMAHYSYASPDRQWVLIVEMGPGGGFGQPCRLVPFDGSSRGREVGPQGACRSAAWSPDGRWMYFGAVVNQRSHLWRQSFPNGTPEQMTFDPTEEEGVAVAPDGSWLVTSVGAAGAERTAVWIHDGNEERQVTSEGSARVARLSRDGRQVFYLHGETLPASELRRVDLVSGRSDNVLPGRLVSGYEISPDETEVAFTSLGTGARPEIWLASLDRRSPPRLVTSGGDQPSFGPNGTLVFRQIERNASYLHRINRDGSGNERLLAPPIVAKAAVSPDFEWVIINRGRGNATRGSVGERAETVAISLRGGSPRTLCAFNCLPGAMWSRDTRVLFITAGRGRAVQLPLPSGRLLPDLPSSGIASPADAVNVPGARLIEQSAASPGPGASTYVFTKAEIRRNLFRLQLR
jgi:serine/threonine protein kinase/Tol biopolymer transport system component